jgi:8-oxo-dGTP pyrophosphatase MutT (NUDIX family)
MRREFSAGAVVYFKDEQEDRLEYLVLHYGNSHWDFPKGKLEPGESNEMAAIREIKEETGLIVDLDKGFEHKLFYKFRSRDGELVSKQVTFFVAQSQTKDVVLSEEHSAYQWHTYEEARRILTYDNAVNLLDISHAFITKLHGP